MACGVACKDHGSRCTSSGGNLLLAVRHLGGIAPGSATGTLSGKPETPDHKITAADSLDRSHPRRSVDRTDADAQPLSHQASAVGLQWLGTEDLHQWRIPLCQRRTQTIQKGPSRPRTKPQLQSRFEKRLQRRGHASGCHCGALSEFLRSLCCPRDETAFGASHLGTQDRSHHFAGYRNRTFGTITARRINIVEPDGTVRLTISNRADFPGAWNRGKEYARPDRREAAGMLFVSDEGTEQGGFHLGCGATTGRLHPKSCPSYGKRRPG